jgi:hypothetical protein
MNSFLGDYYGQRCHSDKKSSDIFNDYLDLLDDIACVEDELNWQLNHNAIDAEFESWNVVCYRLFIDVLPMITTWTILHVWFLQTDAWI